MKDFKNMALRQSWDGESMEGNVLNEIDLTDKIPQEYRVYRVTVYSDDSLIVRRRESMTILVETCFDNVAQFLSSLERDEFLAVVAPLLAWWVPTD